MKKNVVLCLLLPLFFAGISNSFAQSDSVKVFPVHDPNFECGFNLFVSNHNSGGKAIDEVKIEITSSNGVTFDQFSGPNTHWTTNIDGTSLIANAVADNGGIAPNATQGGFIFSYIDNQFDDQVTIQWTTRNSGVDISTGTIFPVCTQYQSYTQIDTVNSVITSKNGPDPCFTFTMQNRNLPQAAQIYNVSFRLENQSEGAMRPSKITPAKDWILDSVTTLAAFFHTDVNPINPGASVGGWTVCLRANVASTKFDFVWTASDAANFFIDRDTIRSIPNTANSALTDADSLSVKTVSGCLYNVTLKNFHLANNQPPSRIVKLVLRNKTSGVTFTAAPNLPQHWKKTVTGDSIVFVADSLFYGIPDGIVSTDQFSFSVSGPTTSNFDIGWETYHGGSPFPPNVTLLTTGTVTTKCTAAAPSADLAVNAPGLSTCDYKLTVTNAHNITPPSNLHSLLIFIPAAAGQLNGTAGPAGWNWISNGNGDSITSKASIASDNMPSGTSQDFLYSFVPKNPGTNVTATWKTVDDQGQTTGTGTYTINCSPIVTLCDTLVESGSVSDDSCVKTLNLTNRKTDAITQVVISSTNGWTIAAANTPTGWTKQNVGLNQVNYTSNDGLAPGAQQAFQLQFANYYPDTATVPPANSFFVNWSTTDVKSNSCHDSLIVTPGCLARPFHVTTGSVATGSHGIGVANFTIIPNPTRGSAEIAFDLQSSERVNITVLDVLGHQIATISSKMMSQGSYKMPYVMSGLPDGTYYVRVQTPQGVMTQKLVLTK